MQFFYNLTLMLTTLMFVGSCSVPKKNNAEPRPTKLRIVDLQGNPHPVKMRTPELNVPALAAQGNLDEEKMATLPEPRNSSDFTVAKNKYATDNYPASANYPGTTDPLQQTLETPQAPENNAAAAPEIVASAAPKKGKDVVEYDLTTDNNDKSLKSKPALAAVDKSAAVKTEKHKGIYVQAGSFSVMQHAKNSVAHVKKLSGSSDVSIEEALINDKNIYRVLIGPFANKQKASAMIDRLSRSGHQAIIVRNR